MHFCPKMGETRNFNRNNCKNKKAKLVNLVFTQILINYHRRNEGIRFIKSKLINLARVKFISCIKEYCGHFLVSDIVYFLVIFVECYLQLV